MTLDNILRELILWQNPRTPVEDKISYAKKQIQELMLGEGEIMQSLIKVLFVDKQCRGEILGGM